MLILVFEVQGEKEEGRGCGGGIEDSLYYGLLLYEGC